jgi:hypothetical protein
MSLHFKPVTERLVIEIRKYAEPDPVEAYRDRRPILAVATAIVCPFSKIAILEAAHGDLTHADVMGAFDGLRELYGAARVQWERANGKKVKLRWDSQRGRWVNDTFGAWEA